MSLTFQILDKQMHVTRNCKNVQYIYEELIACADKKKTSLMSVFYILGVYHKHII